MEDKTNFVFYSGIPNVYHRDIDISSVNAKKDYRERERGKKENETEKHKAKDKERQKLLAKIPPI